MLKPQVASGSWQLWNRSGRRWLVRSAIACGGVAAALSVVQLALLAPRDAPISAAPAPAPAPIVVTVPVPVAPTVTVNVPPPPAPPLPPDPPAPDTVMAPEPVHTACVADVANLGVPIAGVDATAPSIGTAVHAAASADACTVAAWTDHAIDVSWDGGQTFAHYEADDVELVRVAVAAGRVVALTGSGALGVAHAGDRDLTWRALGEISSDVGPETGLLAAGPWTALAVTHTPTDGSGDTGAPTTTAAVSADDGATWQYFALPVADALLAELGPNGQLAATHVRYLNELDGDSIPDLVTDRWTTGVAHPAWARGGGSPRGQVLARGAWTYTSRGDKFWGCGGSTQLVAARGGREVKLAGDLRTESWDIPLAAAARGDVAYIQMNGLVERYVGAQLDRNAPLPASADPVELVGIDAAGTAIALQDTRLVRWSPRGGWRVLHTMTAPVDDDTP